MNYGNCRLTMGTTKNCSFRCELNKKTFHILVNRTERISIHSGESKSTKYGHDEDCKVIMTF
jgi:hypothetical protein